MRTTFPAIAILSSLLTAGLSHAAPVSISMTATVLSKSQCKFNTAASALNFGDLDPANPTDKTVFTTIIFRCNGSANPATFFISDDDGLYETGPNANRMRHATITTEYLPYSITLNPVTDTVPRLTNQTLTVTGIVKGLDYQGIWAGGYSDTVIISINP